MTCVAAPWRNASPLAAPRATFILKSHDSGWKYDPPADRNDDDEDDDYDYEEDVDQRTPEEMVLQAASRHELVDQHPLLLLGAVPDQLHQIGVIQPPQIINLRLEKKTRPFSSFMNKKIQRSVIVAV